MTSAVNHSNYEARFNSADTYASGDRVSYYYRLGVTANYPLGAYLGASLSADYGTTTLLPTQATNTLNAAYPWGECNYHNTDLAARLFARVTSIGRIDIGYGTNRLDSHCQATFIGTDTNTLDTDTLNGNAEYYFSRITIAAMWSRTHIQNDGELYTDSLYAAWYPTNLSRIGITAYGRNLNNTYNVDVEYQPDFLGNELGVVFSYTSQRRAESNQTYMVGLRYYFGTNVDLLERDRFYR